MHVFVKEGVVLFEGALPETAINQTTGAIVILAEASLEDIEATGWLEYTDVTRPPDTSVDTFDKIFTVVGGHPVLSWVQRNKTVDELKSDNDSAKDINLKNSISTLRAWAVTGRATTVTTTNVVAVVNALIKNQATFYDNFADLLELKL